MTAVIYVPFMGRIIHFINRIYFLTGNDKTKIFFLLFLAFRTIIRREWWKAMLK